MTRHTLELHCPQHGLFAVSSLGRPIPALRKTKEPFTPRPMGLAEPLDLVGRIAASDSTRRSLNYCGIAAATMSPLLERCVASFRRRYPARLSQQLPASSARSAATTCPPSHLAGACGVVPFLVWTYDAWGEHRAALRCRQCRRSGGRTPNWLCIRPGIRRGTGCILRRRSNSGSASWTNAFTTSNTPSGWPNCAIMPPTPTPMRKRYGRSSRRFHRDFPEHDVDSDWQQFRDCLQGAPRCRARTPRRTWPSASWNEPVNKVILPLADRAGRSFSARFRRHHVTSREVRRRRAAFLLRLDERDIESARAYSAAQPLNFQTRREHYQRYLERHPDGAFASEANEALKNIDADWDKHDFRAVRDHFQAHPGDVKELQVRCRSYLAVHPNGRFRDTARDLLRWTERVTQPGEYRVVLKSGSFDRKVAHFFSRGPSLSVEIEVNGVRYGPSNIVPRNYQPEWNYEFPRRVRWKLGDSVRIVVTDNYYWDRRVAEISSEENDPLAMRLLSGEVNAGKNSLMFESDFTMPVMPKIE